MIIDIAWIYTVGFGMIFLCQQLSHWNCAIPTYKSRAQSRWTESKREEAKGTFFSSQQSCNFDSFLSLQGFVFFIIDLCKKKCEWLCTYYLTSWMFILQVTQVGKGSSEGKKVQRILLLDYVLGIWKELKIAKIEIKSEAILEGWWYTGRKIHQIWAGLAVCVRCYFHDGFRFHFIFSNFEFLLHPKNIIKQ